ncbi:MAG: light-harvesting protein [Rhodomicrobium sp.]|jgi:light-harvesting protein B-800-850 alpha chain
MADTDGQAAIWLYVRPSLGLPHFLGAVLLIAVAVHAGLIGHTKWYNQYWEGGKKVSISHVLPGNNA